jgi:hypothetical protein
MKRLEFYKPNKSNSGACLTLQFRNEPPQEENKKDNKNGLYVNILKQASWNEQTRSGSFKANVDNPEKHKKIKLTETEIGNILHVINSKGLAKFSTVHSRGDVKTQIFFEPYQKEDSLIGFIFRVSNLSIALNMGEAELFSEYLKSGIRFLFS